MHQGLVGKIKLDFKCGIYILCMGRKGSYTYMYTYNYSYRLLQLIIIVLKEMF